MWCAKGFSKCKLTINKGFHPLCIRQIGPYFCIR
jgi:hypothetical protein